MAAVFNLTNTSSASVGTNLWVDLGLITTGYDFFIGSAKWGCSTKAVTFNLRTNLVGLSTGTTANTKLLSTYQIGGSKTPSYTQDLYKSGTIHTATVKSTGVEHWWLNLTSKTSTLGTATWTIYYCLE